MMYNDVSNMWYPDQKNGMNKCDAGEELMKHVVSPLKHASGLMMYMYIHDIGFDAVCYVGYIGCMMCNDV